MVYVRNVMELCCLLQFATRCRNSCTMSTAHFLFLATRICCIIWTNEARPACTCRIFRYLHVCILLDLMTVIACKISCTFLPRKQAKPHALCSWMGSKWGPEEQLRVYWAKTSWVMAKTFFSVQQEFCNYLTLSAPAGVNVSPFYIPLHHILILCVWKILLLRQQCPLWCFLSGQLTIV